MVWRWRVSDDAPPVFYYRRWHGYMAAIHASRLTAQADPPWNQNVNMPLSNEKMELGFIKFLKS